MCIVSCVRIFIFIFPYIDKELRLQFEALSIENKNQHVLLVKKEAELIQKDTELIRKDATLIEKETTELNRKRKLIHVGLPPIDMFRTCYGLTPNSNKPAGSGKHEPLTEVLKQKLFNVMPSVEMNGLDNSRIWAQLGEDASLRWNCESRIQQYVMMVLEDCIASAGLHKNMTLSPEVTISADNRADVMVFKVLDNISQRGIAVGVVEVQKPVDDVESSPAANKSPKSNTTTTIVPYTVNTPHCSNNNSNIVQHPVQVNSALPPLPVSSSFPVFAARRSPRLSPVPVMSINTSSNSNTSNNAIPPTSPNDQPLDRKLGQVYAYMRKLRDDYGIRDVFGIVTNYAYWRIVWLPDSDTSAAATLPRSEEEIKEVEEEELVEDTFK
jgi:hypothetical protein